MGQQKAQNKKVHLNTNTALITINPKWTQVLQLSEVLQTIKKTYSKRKAWVNDLERNFPLEKVQMEWLVHTKKCSTSISNQEKKNMINHYSLPKQAKIKKSDKIKCQQECALLKTLSWDNYFEKSLLVSDKAEGKHVS